MRRTSEICIFGNEKQQYCKLCRCILQSFSFFPQRETTPFEVVLTTKALDVHTNTGHFLLVDFVFSLQIMRGYLGGLNLCYGYEKDCVRSWKCPTLKESTFLHEYRLMICIDRFAHTAAILISIVSNSYYGMLWGQIHIHLPPEHPIMSFETIEIKMAA